jgi:urease accessory protein
MSHAPAAPWLGRLHLAFVRAGDRTDLVRPFATAPLAVSRAFYPDGGDACHAMILHNAGGMVAGDEIDLQATVGPAARAVLTTASAGKIYRSTGARTRQRVGLQVADGASLAWVPQETIVFDGADYRQDLTVDLADGAGYLGWDLVRFGRTAHGERFHHGRYRSHTTVHREGRPLWIDRQHLDGGEAIDSPQGLAGRPVVGTLVWIGATVDGGLVEQVRQAWTDLAAAGDVGVTAVAAGLVCRYRGPSSAQARRWFAAVWTLANAVGAPPGGERRELPACTRLR